MYLPDIELHESTTLNDAVALMDRYKPSVRLLAGGTDLLVDLKTQRASANHLVSLQKVESLRGITETDVGLRIGALTTITQLGTSPIVRERYSPIVDATSKMAAPQIRNVATVGGNVASAVPCADLPPILIAMNASVEVFSAGAIRTIALDAFFIGVRQTALRDNDVLTAIVVPKPSLASGTAYARFALREGNAIAVASVAVGLTLDNSGTIQQARIVLGAVAPVPMLVKTAGESLVGRTLCGQAEDDEAINVAAKTARQAAQPISDVRGSADFRREMVEVLTRCALRAARHRAHVDGSAKPARRM